MDAEGPGASRAFLGDLAWSAGKGIHQWHAARLSGWQAEAGHRRARSPNVSIKGPLWASRSPEGSRPRPSIDFAVTIFTCPFRTRKHCKITYETSADVDRGAKKGEALYYQINYRTYEEGTQVKSFSLRPTGTPGWKRSMRVQQQLVKTGVSDRSRSSNRDCDHRDDRPPASLNRRRWTVPGAIRQLTMNLKADDLSQALRSTILEISFDGQRTVWCPVGEFFGIGYKFNRRTRPGTREVLDNGDMNCFWVMPFEASCELTLHNLGDQTVELVNGEAAWSPWDWDDRSMYFHATWRQLTKVDTRGGKSMDGQRCLRCELRGSERTRASTWATR